MTAATLLFAACSGESNGGTAATSTAKSSDEVTERETPSEGDPTAGLDSITRDDLPDGWRELPSVTDQAASIDCFQESAGIAFAEGDSGKSFARDDSKAFIGVTATSTESVAAAEDGMTRLVEALRTCDGSSHPDDGGGTVTWSVYPWSTFPELGDDTIAARISATTNMGPVVVEVVQTRVRDVLVMTLHMAISAADSQLTEHVQRTAAQT